MARMLTPSTDEGILDFEGLPRCLGEWSVIIRTAENVLEQQGLEAPFISLSNTTTPELRPSTPELCNPCDPEKNTTSKISTLKP